MDIQGLLHAFVHKSDSTVGDMMLLQVGPTYALGSRNRQECPAAVFFTPQLFPPTCGIDAVEA